MKRTKLPKLAVVTATVRMLDTTELARIAGGSPKPTISSPPATCGLVTQ